MCPGSSDPFYIASLLYKMGHYFLDILYVQNKQMLKAGDLVFLDSSRENGEKEDFLLIVGKIHLFVL